MLAASSFSCTLLLKCLQSAVFQPVDAAPRLPERRKRLYVYVLVMPFHMGDFISQLHFSESLSQLTPSFL